MHPSIGKILMLFGAVLLAIGAIVYFFGDKMKWFGRLPGDIRIEEGNTKVYIPIVTMIIISIVLTVLINLIRKLF
ncbi:MAG: DUF2905 domain-containing protein [Bacteroidales bacterium]|nr:DUF2905 domain-containing protein [Bacteroidales bacterium]